LAALFAMTKIADALQKTEDKDKFQKLLDKGKVAFERKLWNGRNYNFDCSNEECRSIMADQLCGQWYLRSCGFNYEVMLIMITLLKMYSQSCVCKGVSSRSCQNCLENYLREQRTVVL
jgi:hypothetical protein